MSCSGQTSLSTQPPSRSCSRRRAAPFRMHCIYSPSQQPKLYHVQVGLLWSFGRSGAAVRLLRMASSIAPDNPTVKFRLAFGAWHGENRGEEALDQLAALIQEAHPTPLPEVHQPSVRKECSCPQTSNRQHAFSAALHRTHASHCI